MSPVRTPTNPVRPDRQPDQGSLPILTALCSFLANIRSQCLYRLRREIKAGSLFALDPLLFVVPSWSRQQIAVRLVQQISCVQESDALVGFHRSSFASADT